MRWIVVPAALAALSGSMLGAVAVHSWRQAEEVRQYYAFASPSALRALDGLSARLEPNEIVVTDRCWSFLATWLLHTRTYPALEEQDIQPKAELLIARRAAAILHGTAEGRRLMRELPVRYAVLDPTCPVNGYRFFPPGEPLFAGARIAIVKLDPDRKNPKAPTARAPSADPPDSRPAYRLRAVFFGASGFFITTPIRTRGSASFLGLATCTNDSRSPFLIARCR